MTSLTANMTNDNKHDHIHAGANDNKVMTFMTTNGIVVIVIVIVVIVVIVIVIIVSVIVVTITIITMTITTIPITWYDNKFTRTTVIMAMTMKRVQAC